MRILEIEKLEYLNQLSESLSNEDYSSCPASLPKFY